VGVLRGGPSPEYEVSLNTGKNILANMPEDFEPVDILISKDGIWHESGIEKSPEKILRKLDLVINGLHGSYGEDGRVQKILETFRVPFTGSDSVSSAFSMNKAISKDIYRGIGLKTPFSKTIPFERLSVSAIRDAYHSIPSPFVVKPSAAGSSIGVYVSRSLPELEEAVIAASRFSPSVIVEEFIGGKEATSGVIDGFRGSSYYPLVPVEIRHGKDFFDYDSKYLESGTQEICPGNFSEQETQDLAEMAIAAHRALGLRHYSRSDFIIHPKRGIFILETNSLPGLTEHSLVPKSLKAVGSSIKEFIEHLIHKILGKI
jgi:D-alanine-D-alanine ligase